MHPSSGYVQPRPDLQLLPSLPPSKSFCSQDTQVSGSSALQSPANLAGSLLLPWKTERLKASTLPLPYHNIFFYPAISNIIFDVSLGSITWISERLIISNHLKNKKRKKKSSFLMKGIICVPLADIYHCNFLNDFQMRLPWFLAQNLCLYLKTSLVCKQTRSCPHILQYHVTYAWCICAWKCDPLQQSEKLYHYRRLYFFFFIFIGQWRERNTSYRNYFPTGRAWKQ